MEEDCVADSASPHVEQEHLIQTRTRTESPISTTSQVNLAANTSTAASNGLARRERDHTERKRRRSPSQAGPSAALSRDSANRPPYLPSIHGCRNVDQFQLLNRIEEGTYGVVFRAKDKRTNELVALKRVKLERKDDEFPITSLREINMLLIARHENVVLIREVVFGAELDQIYIVMDFVEQDLAAVMKLKKQSNQRFQASEIKCLMAQLLRAVEHLHDNWILHRDLKTSNLLISNSGVLKVCDFGLARAYGSPLHSYTPVVVTLWYRAPELLLGCSKYSTHVDVWAVGCIFAELILMQPVFAGKSEQDQLHQIYKLLGTPSERIWPGYSSLPLTRKIQFVDFPVSHLRTRMAHESVTEAGLHLLRSFFIYDPERRISCGEALTADYFREEPLESSRHDLAIAIQPLT